MNKRIIITSGYFDPIHEGHIEYLRRAKDLGGRLIVILNNDAQCMLKKGKSFYPEMRERRAIVKALRYVDEIFDSVDEDEGVCKSIEAIARRYNGDELIFAKGGDRFSYEIPEAKVCKELGIKIVDGLGKKIQSSSSLTGLNERK